MTDWKNVQILQPTECKKNTLNYSYIMKVATCT